MEEKLSLNDLAIEALKTSAKWCMFLSIIGFIFIGLMVVAGAVMSVAMSAMPADPYGGAMGMGGFEAIKGYIGISYIVLALIYFFPVYYLFNYATGTRKAIDSGNEDALANALINLKSHHKFLGIATIVMIVLYIFMIIGVVVFAASAAGQMGTM
jgi:hypothetical protein